MRTSPAGVFVGRLDALDALGRAWEAAAETTTQAAIVTGEAGVGKTSLLEHFVTGIDGRPTVLSGGCVPQSSGILPLAPFVAAVRRLRRSLPADRVADMLGPELETRLDAVVPRSMVEDPVAPGGVDLSRSRLFDAYLSFVEAVSAQGPVVFVVEDLHWADLPTLDLLSYLLANLQVRRLLLIVTHRPVNAADGAVGSVLSDLSRFRNLARIELSGLVVEEVRDQLRHLLHRDPEPGLVADVVRRTGGIPLYVDALITPDGQLATGVPGAVRDLLLRPLNGLRAESRQIVQAMSLAGPQIGHPLLAAVTGLPRDDVAAGLRAALDASLLTSTEVGYRFRHDLIGQALRDHLLPGERADLHRRFAEALAVGAGSDVDDEGSDAPEIHRLVRIAHHWRGAHDHRHTLRAAVTAADRAAASGRHLEQLDMLDLALQVWDRVPDAQTELGFERVTLVEKAAKASCWAAAPEQGSRFVAAALELLDEKQDPDRCAAMLIERASCRQLLLASPAIDDLERGLALPVSDQRLQVELAGMLARTALDEDDLATAVTATDTLVRIARRAGDSERLDADITTLRLDLHRNDAAGLLPRAQQLLDAAQALGHDELATMAALTQVRALTWSGDLDAAAERGRLAYGRYGRGSLQPYYGARLAFETASALLAASRWDEAIDIIEQGAGAATAPHHVAYLHLVRAEATMRLGPLLDTERNLAAVDRLMVDSAGFAQLDLARLRLNVEHAQLIGDVPQVLRYATAITDLGGPSRLRWPALAAAAGAMAAGAVRDRATSDGALNRLAAASRDVPVLGETEQAHAAALRADLARAAGNDDPAAWLDVAERWGSLHRPYERAVALLRASGATAPQDRDQAAVLLDEAAVGAEAIAASVLGREIAALGRRLGVGIGQADDTGAPDPLRTRLTSRETEVLRLVALGQSNSEIAAELYISRKTASVHVSNILGKLGVPTRGAAAALAHRRQMFDLA